MATTMSMDRVIAAATDGDPSAEISGFDVTLRMIKALAAEIDALVDRIAFLEEEHARSVWWERSMAHVLYCVVHKKTLDRSWTAWVDELEADRQQREAEYEALQAREGGRKAGV